MVKISTESEKVYKYAIGDEVIVTEDINEHKKGDIRTIIGFGSPSGHFDYSLDDGYIHECHIKLLEPLGPLESKLTKNQRITALENEVFRLKSLEKEVIELKSIVNELRNKSDTESPKINDTKTEATISFEGEEYCRVNREACDGDVVIIREPAKDSKYARINTPHKVVIDKFGKSCIGKPDIALVYNIYFGRTSETVEVYELIKERNIIEFNGQKYSKVNREAQTGDVVVFRVNNTDLRHSTINEPYEVIGEYGGRVRFIGDSGSKYYVYTKDHGRTLETVEVYELIKE